jgi:hypothetical protein
LFSFLIAFSTHSKHKRTQLRAAQNRYRKQKSLLCHLKTLTTSSNVLSPVVEELPSTDIETIIVNTNDVLPSVPIPLPGSDRQTRGFRFHIEPKTHTITRTNKKQKLIDTSQISTSNIKQEPIELNHFISEASSSSSSTTTHVSIKGLEFEKKRSFLLFNKFFFLESKRLRIPKKKRSLSPPATLNVLSSNSNCAPSPNKAKRKRSFFPKSQSLKESVPKIEVQQPSSLIRSTQYPIPPPPIDPRNPVTWNVNDVCWYLNESGCSFALKTIKEQVKQNIIVLFF